MYYFNSIIAGSSHHLVTPLQIIKTINKKPKIMKKHILAVALLTISSPSFATPLSEEDWNGFYTELNKSCIDKQTKISATTYQSDDQIKGFCSCTSKKITSSLSYEDLEHMENTGDNTHFTAVVSSAGTACTKE